MKSVLLILFIFASFFVLKAQDTLFLKDQKVLYVKVYKVHRSKIDYKLYSNQDGVMLRMLLRKIARIGYGYKADSVGGKIALAQKDSIQRRIRLGFDNYQFNTPYPYLPSRFYIEHLSKYGGFGVSFPISIYTGAKGFAGFGLGVSVKKYWENGSGFFYGALFDLGAIGYSELDIIDTKAPSLMIYGAGKVGYQAALTKRLGLNIGVDAGFMSDFNQTVFVATIFMGFNYAI